MVLFSTNSAVETKRAPFSSRRARFFCRGKNRLFGQVPGQTRQHLAHHFQDPSIGHSFGLILVHCSDKAHDGTVRAADRDAVIDDRDLGQIVVRHPLAALFEPIVNQLLLQAALDHRTVQLKRTVDRVRHVYFAGAELEDFPPGARKTNLWRVDAAAIDLLFIPRGGEVHAVVPIRRDIIDVGVVVGPKGVLDAYAQLVGKAVSTVETGWER